MGDGGIGAAGGKVDLITTYTQVPPAPRWVLGRQTQFLLFLLSHFPSLATDSCVWGWIYVFCICLVIYSLFIGAQKNIVDSS